VQHLEQLVSRELDLVSFWVSSAHRRFCA
jgi:hypothetical protein